MRAVYTAALALTGMAMAFGANANPKCDVVRMALVQLYSTATETGSGSAPRNVTPGETFMVTGECVGDMDDDVRVVLSLDDGADATAGFHEMLATDQVRKDGSLSVRVPNMKETRNHTFRVRLFVGSDDPRICDAGSIRVV